MPLRQMIVVSVLSLGMMGWVLWLLYRRRLREEYALLWLAGGVVGLVCAFWYQGLMWASSLMGIVIPTSTIFFLALAGLALINLHFAVKISDLSEKVQTLAQILAVKRARPGRKR